MTRFQDSKIYKIVSSAGVYYGSTYCTLSRRLSKHVGNYKLWVADNTKGYMSSYKVLASPPYRIVLVKNYPCANREELFRKEQQYIDENSCVNLVKAYQSEDERKEAAKQYYEENKEDIKTRVKQYVGKNKEKVAAYQKKYNSTNKEKIADYHKQYYKDRKEETLIKVKKYRVDNSDKVRECDKKRYKKKRNIVQCHCGGSYNRGAISNRKDHYKTRKHKQYVASIYGGHSLLQSHE